MNNKCLKPNQKSCVLSRTKLKKLPSAKVREIVAKFRENGTFEDTRQASKIEYSLDMLFFITLLSWLCGCRSAYALEHFTIMSGKKLKKLIVGYNGKPISHDTFNRFLSRCITSNF